MTDLKTVKFISVTHPKIGEDVFAGTWDPEDFAILVPNAGLSPYKAISDVYWKNSAVPRLKGY